MQNASAACAAMYLLATVSLVLQMALPPGSFDGAVMFYACALPVAVAGVYVCQLRHDWILRAPLHALRSPYDWHHRIRSLLQQAIEDALIRQQEGTPRAGDADTALLLGGGGDVAGASAVSSASSSSPTTGGGGGGPALSASDAAHLKTLHVVSLLFQPSAAGAHAGGARKRGAAGRGGGSSASSMPTHLSDMDLPQREETVREILPPSVLEEAERLYKLAASRFGRSSMLHALAATFSAVYCGNTKAQLSHFIQALRLKPALDVEFEGYRARKQHDSSAGSLSILSRIAFDKNLAEARRAAKQAGVAQAAFFGKLMEQSPSLSELHSIAERIASESVTAEAALSQVAALNPTSIAYLRLHSTYCHLMNNVDRATSLAAEADRLEEAKTREHQHQVTNRTSGVGGVGGSSFATPPLLTELSRDIIGDSQASIDVSASIRNPGIILGVSAAACRLFGYPSKSALEKRSINMLMPSSVAVVHDAVLTRVLESGVSGFVDATRLLMIKHRAGYVMPAYISTHEMPAQGDGHSEGTYTVCLRPCVANEHFFVMDGSLMIHEGSQGSLAMLGMDAGTLKGAELKLTDLIREDMEAVTPLLMRPNGHIVSITTRPVAADRIRGLHEEDGGSEAQDLEGNDAYADAQRAVKQAASRTMQVRARLQPINHGYIRTAVLSWRPLNVAAAQSAASSMRRGSLRDSDRHRGSHYGGYGERRPSSASMAHSLVSMAGGGGGGGGLLLGELQAAPPPLQQSPPSRGLARPLGSPPVGLLAGGGTAAVSSRGVSFKPHSIDAPAVATNSPSTSDAARPSGIVLSSGIAASAAAVAAVARTIGQPPPRPATPLQDGPAAATAAFAVGLRDDGDAGELDSRDGGSSQSRGDDGTDDGVSSDGGGDGEEEEQDGDELAAAGGLRERLRAGMSPRMGGGGGGKEAAHMEDVDMLPLSASSQSHGGGAGGDNGDGSGYVAEERSVGGGSFNSSSTYSRKVRTRLRRSLLESSVGVHGTTGIGFRPLRMLFTVATVVVAASVVLAIAAALVIDRAFETNQKLVSFSRAAHETSETSQQIARLALERALWLGGWLPSSVAAQTVATHYVDHESQHFSSNLELMAATSKSASTTSDSQFTAPDVEMYSFISAVFLPRDTVSDTDFSRMLHGGVLFPVNNYAEQTVVGTVEHVSLSEVGRKWGSRAKAWAALPLADTHSDSPVTRFIIENGIAGA